MAPYSLDKGQVIEQLCGYRVASQGQQSRRKKRTRENPSQSGKKGHLVGTPSKMGLNNPFVSTWGMTNNKKLPEKL